jgi:hypothetical protein
MSFSNYAEGVVLDHVFGKTVFTQPTLYLAVSTANPLDTNAGIAEPVGNGYARVTTAPANWSRTAGVMSNGVEFAFPEATGSQGTLTHFALFDALTAGNLVAHGALTTPKAIASAETLRFPIGNLTFSLD